MKDSYINTKWQSSASEIVVEVRSIFKFTKTTDQLSPLKWSQMSPLMISWVISRAASMSPRAKAPKIRPFKSYKNIKWSNPGSKKKVKNLKSSFLEVKWSTPKERSLMRLNRWLTSQMFWRKKSFKDIILSRKLTTSICYRLKKNQKFI